MTKPPTKPTKSSSSATIIVAVIATVVIILGGVAAATWSELQALRGQGIEHAAGPHLTFPIVTVLFALVALGWAIWLWRTRGPRNFGTIIVAVITAVMLILSPLITYQALTAERDLTITTMVCATEGLTPSNASPTAGCEDAAVDTIVLLSGKESDDVWLPDDESTNEVRTFSGLPAGSWSAELTVDGPESTVMAFVLVERDGTWRRIAQLRPAMDSESGRLRWSSTVDVSRDDSALKVQFVESANDAVGSAQIRFNVKECPGQNPRNFDASTCQPANIGASLVREDTPNGQRTWRQPYVVSDGGTIVVTNLEARTYTFVPDYVAIQTLTQSNEVLVIPTAMEPTEANSITHPGEDAFEISIATNTATIEFTIYIFPSGANYAFAP